MSHTRSHVSIGGVTCLALFLLAASGCGEPRLPRVAVSGTVTLDGQSLKSGSIMFEPINGVKGPKAGGPIVDGRFELDEDLGPMIGTLRVEITGDPETAAPPLDPRNAPPLPTEAPAPAPHGPGGPRRPHHPAVQNGDSPHGEMVENIVPARYNDETELVVETTAAGPNSFTFELVTTPE